MHFQAVRKLFHCGHCPVVGHQIVAALFDCFVFGHKRIMGYIPTNLSNPSDL
jgi:hypothetical protein